ncbi:MAG: aconitase X catalytic domain-containing protein [Actinomycetota bacterium]|nr:aconitase X catalytic domain-containing protein [Actinomycetota bacterium]
MSVNLSESDEAYLNGEQGPAAASAMRVIVRLAEAMGASELLDVSSAHIDSCLYHGPAVLDFAKWLEDQGGKVKIPTTLNVSSLDLIHPDLYRGDSHWGEQARLLMDSYERMGCKPTWTCAPYQLEERPNFGDQVAWAESNAIVFANSVLGARTHRYGDFIDICAAICGRAPAAGLHLDQNRKGEILFRIKGINESLLDRDVFYPVLGHLVGKCTGSAIPVIQGLPNEVSEDRLKALGAAAASSGSVGMFHAVGITPEAPTLEEAFLGLTPREVIDVTIDKIISARDELSTVSDFKVGAVSLGTPHYSIQEIQKLSQLFDGRSVNPEIKFYVSTGRDVLTEASLRGLVEPLEKAGVIFVTDTCTYITPIIEDVARPVITDSAKWAYYAPGNLGVEVIFAAVEDCVTSAVSGSFSADNSIWMDG